MRESLHTVRTEMLVSEVQDLCLLNNGWHIKASGCEERGQQVGGETGVPDNSCRTHKTVYVVSCP